MATSTSHQRASDTSKELSRLMKDSTHEKLNIPSPLRPFEISAVRRRPKRLTLLNLTIVISFLISTMMASVLWMRCSTVNNDEPNPPVLPSSMRLLHPPQNDGEIDELTATLRRYSDPIMTWHEFTNRSSDHDEPHLEFTHTSSRHFSFHRTALLFLPGEYPVDFQVGYYTSVVGLGLHPSDVSFSGRGPHVDALDKFTIRPPYGSGLDTFWRSVENVRVEKMTWAASQAAFLRRVHVRADLHLFDGGEWASGGFGANLVVNGKVSFGGQQQWVMRNAQVGPVEGGAWSLVFVGCSGVSGDSDGSTGPSISVETDPVVRLEKPFIVVRDVEEKSEDRGGETFPLELRVPKVTRGENASGYQFDGRLDEVRDFRRVKLAEPSISLDSLTAATENSNLLQKALDQGRDLVLSPGIYPLTSSLEVRHPNQVILGLGFATLLAPSDGSPCIHVHSRVPGVRVAGLMLEATVLSAEGQTRDSSLLQWGEPGVVDDGEYDNPGLLADIFARVGGSSIDRSVSTDTMIVLHSGNLYGDNLWLWRADHVALRPGEQPNFPEISRFYHQTTEGECNVKNGLIVNGANVTIVGLAVEHTIQDQTIWNGENGESDSHWAVYFYQSEFPYDVDDSFATNDYVGYRVSSKVKNHTVYGLGVYSNFRDHDVSVKTAAVIPESPGIHTKNIFTVKLDNMGEIRSVVNGLGPGPTPEMERGRPLRCWNMSCL